MRLNLAAFLIFALAAGNWGCAVSFPAVSAQPKEESSKSETQAERVAEKTALCPHGNAYDFSGLFQTSRGFRDDVKEKERKILEAEFIAGGVEEDEQKLFWTLLDSLDPLAFRSILSGEPFPSAPLAEYALRNHYSTIKYQKDNLKKMIDTGVQLVSESPWDVERLEMVLQSFNMPHSFDRELCDAVTVLATRQELDPWAREILLGEVAQLRGWMARGYGYSNTVAAEAWPVFQKELKTAMMHYLNAAFLRPGRILPYEKLCAAVYPYSVARRALRQATSIQADSREAIVCTSISMMPRWGGCSCGNLALANAIWKSPLIAKGEMMERVVSCLVFAAYEGLGAKYPTILRNNPELAQAVLSYFDGLGERAKTEQETARVSFRKIVFLLVLGRWKEAASLNEDLTDFQRARAKLQLSCESGNGLVGNTGYFAWVGAEDILDFYETHPKAATQLCEAETDFLEGREAEAFKKLEKLIADARAAQYSRKNMRLLFSFYGQWALNANPAELDNRAVWQVEERRKQPPVVLIRLLEMGLPLNDFYGRDYVLYAAMRAGVPEKVLEKYLPAPMGSFSLGKGENILHYSARYPGYANLFRRYAEESPNDLLDAMEKKPTPLDLAKQSGNMAVIQEIETFLSKHSRSE